MQAKLLDSVVTSTISPSQDVTGPFMLHVSGDLNGSSIRVLISPDNVEPYVPYDFGSQGNLRGTDIYGPGVYKVDAVGTAYKVKLQFVRNQLTQLVPSAVDGVIYN